LAFDKMADEWLNCMQGRVRCYRSLKYHIQLAVDFFGNENIRSVRYSRLEDLLFSLPKSWSPKSTKNVFTTLHSFFGWVCKGEKDKQIPIRMPDFPHIALSPAPLRKMVAKEDQAAILQRVKEKTFEQNPKIYYGILWLLTYGMRPGELVAVRMKDFDNGWMNLINWKGRTTRRILLLPEDWGLVQRDSAIGDTRFFRHTKTRQTMTDEPFGKDLWYRHWKTTARELGFADIDLYGATRHSSASDLSDSYSPEEIRAYWTEHTTTQSFYRYLHPNEKIKRDMYERARRMVENKVIKLEEKDARR